MAHRARGAQQSDGHTAATVASERAKEKEATRRHFATLCPDTRCHTDGTEVRQETATDMVSEPLRGSILWAENGAQFRGKT
eukprot:1605089-Lingulodinium_polyedra.AAC.1